MFNDYIIGHFSHLNMFSVQVKYIKLFCIICTSYTWSLLQPILIKCWFCEVMNKEKYWTCMHVVVVIKVHMIYETGHRKYLLIFVTYIIIYIKAFYTIFQYLMKNVQKKRDRVDVRIICLYTIFNFTFFSWFFFF